MAGRKEAEEITRAADKIADATKAFAQSVDRLVKQGERLEWLYRRFEWKQPLVSGSIEPEQKAEQQQWSPESIRSPVDRQDREKLSEEEAIAIGLEAIRTARGEITHGREWEERLPPPTVEEIEEWERRREKRRR